MNKAFLSLAAKLLEMAADEFSNHGCNDFELDDTPENRALVLDAENWNDSQDHNESELMIHKGKIYVMDSFMMSYCANFLREAAEVAQ